MDAIRDDPDDPFSDPAYTPVTDIVNRYSLGERTHDIISHYLEEQERAWSPQLQVANASTDELSISRAFSRIDWMS